MFCPHCGKEIPNNSKWCKECGEKLKKNLFSKRIIVPISVFVIIIGAIIIGLFSQNTSNKAWIDQINYSNGGYMAFDGNDIYYRGEDGLYLIDSDDNEIQLTQDQPYGIRIANNRVYYLGKGSCLFSINKDGTNLTQLTESGINSYDIKGNDIYYLDNGSIYKNDEIVPINSISGIEEFILDNNNIIYTTNGSIWEWKNGKNSCIANTQNARNLSKQNNKVYFVDSGEGVKAVSSPNDIESIMPGSNITYYTVAKNKMYFIRTIPSSEQQDVMEDILNSPSIKELWKDEPEKKSLYETVFTFYFIYDGFVIDDQNVPISNIPISHLYGSPNGQLYGYDFTIDVTEDKPIKLN